MADVEKLEAPSPALLEALGPLRDHLPLRVRPAIPVSDDELFELCRRNRELRVERTAEGEIIIMPPTGSETGRRGFELTVQFGDWVRRDGRGVGFDSSAGFLLPNGAERSPDLAWIERSRWAQIPPEQQRRFAPICPDFVVELLSPRDDVGEIQATLREYIACGARLGWLIDPDRRRLEVYRPGRPPEMVENPATIAGDPEMSGLVIDLTRIF